MKILIALTYYRPHVSGLTIYVERLARALARRGHTVTVLTSQYEKALPREEVIDGVNVVRVPVAARISKGVLMPTIGIVAHRLVKQHDVISLHLPQLDASGIALRGRWFNKPVLLTYHSDLLLPPGLVNRTANFVVDLSNHLAAKLADGLCAYTEDFANHSRLLKHYLPKTTVITPPVELPEPSIDAISEWRTQHVPEGKSPVIGIAVRLAAEKGVEYLLAALPKILERYPNAVVLHAGPVDQVIGEDAYRAKLQPMLDKYSDQYRFLGTLNPAQMALFFSNLDLHVLPSINNTETFGLVQVEAAICGTPSVASALPGVRMPTKMTGMGRTAEPSNADDLATQMLEVLDNRAKYMRPEQPIRDMFSPDTTAQRYEALLTDMLAEKAK